MATIRPGYNDLLTWCVSNGSRDQLLIDEWNQDKNYNEYDMPIVMQENCYSTHKKVFWKCYKYGNIWDVSIKSRTKFQSGCSHCGYNVFDGKIHYHVKNKKKGTYIVPGESLL